MRQMITTPFYFYKKCASLLVLMLMAWMTSAQVTINIGNAEGNQNLGVDFTVENFTDIGSMQYTITWDPAYLSFDSLGSIGVPASTLNTGNNFLDQGKLTLSWFDATVNGVTLPDGALLYTVHFTVLQAGFSPVNITGDPTPIEFTNSVPEVIDYLINPGSVNGTGVTITGNVFSDENDDCLYQSTETGIENWLVKFVGDSQNFYAGTTTDGYYSILVDSGSYNVEVLLQNNLWTACNNNVSIEASADNSPIVQDFGLDAAFDCPLLNVDISAPFIRRCFQSYYTVNYCNEGTVLAEDPYIEVTLDEYIDFVSASIPSTQNGAGDYVFDLPDLAIGACGSFNITVFVDCDSTVLGQTHCTSAHIFPDSICMPLNSNWSGASLEINGTCDEDEVQFVITNIGDDMIQATNYIVVEDAVMYNPMPLGPLNANGSEPVVLPANGSTYRLEVEQVTDHPGLSMPSLTLEGCGTNGIGEFSTGFVTQFSEDDANSFVSIDCQENIGAYDPNDKRGFPLGYGMEHFIKPNTDIEYLIRFQNTGTDTAFNIVIEDTLTTELNLESMRVAGGSHPFTFEVKDDNLVRFIFTDIMLPDSNVNELASHGFVKFRIAQQPDLIDGTVINNTAGIYFDFNDAIWTNTTDHTVMREFIQVGTQEVFVPGVEVDVYPNPFTDQATFIIKGQTTKNIVFSIFDLSGRQLIRQQHNEASFEFNRNGLPQGMYFYHIESEGVLLSTGKISIQ